MYSGVGLCIQWMVEAVKMGVGLCIQWMVETVMSGGGAMYTVDGGGCKEWGCGYVYSGWWRL